MKKIAFLIIVISFSAFSEPTQQSRDPNLGQQASGGQSLPVVGLCDYVHPCAKQAAPVSLRDNTNTNSTTKGKDAPSQSTQVEGAQ